MLVRESKYQIVGRRVSGLTGTLLDVGARDRVLEKYLPPGLKYVAADIAPGLDLEWDLEKPIDAPDNAYDIVVALDVLEHVEHIHRAYQELLRITRHKLFVSLPNMTCLSLRLQFFATGHLGGKYDLLPEHQGDRHRWLTGYRQVCAFIGHHARSAGCAVTQYDILTGYSRLHALISRLPLPAELRTYTLLFEITKRPMS
ncbi:MAG: class I SAM-dependent methyltransferase [Anaerolineae bacterium]|nr:class I SAM-dependent methyltransferase [Anaerolineae bacterium]